MDKLLTFPHSLSDNRFSSIHSQVTKSSVDLHQNTAAAEGTELSFTERALDVPSICPLGKNNIYSDLVAKCHET